MKSFNPRVLAGGRDLHDGFFLLDCLFQSTRPRGRTRPWKRVKRISRQVSIHASSREDATCAVIIRALKAPGFNPRVLAGGRDIRRIT